MTYRVVQWSTGNVGRHSLVGIDVHPELELVGVFVSNPDKVGRDAGDLAGLGRTLGVAATNDTEALLALKPDCIVHTGMADDRLFDAVADLEGFLRAGCNVVSSSPVMFQYPEPTTRWPHRSSPPRRRLVSRSSSTASTPASPTTPSPSFSRASVSASRRSVAPRC